MRSNIFNEQIAQPTDSIADIKVFLDEREFTPSSADVFAEECETFKFGGELRDNDGDGFTFDGFATLEDAKAFARNFVPADEIVVVD
jgi:hypothetical protein